MRFAVSVSTIVLGLFVLDASATAQDKARREELQKALAPFFSPPEEFRNDFGKYRSPLKFADGSEVRTPEDWQKRRKEIRDDWMTLLGTWPELLERPEVKVLETEKKDGYTLHHVHVQVFEGDRFADSHLLVPDGTGPFPGVVVPFYDSATSAGLGEKGRGTHDYGRQLAKRGFVALCISTPGSLEDPGPKTRDLLTATGERLDRQPLSLLAYVAANCHTALAQRKDVDPKRIGIIGLSYGGKWSMFASCLYDKFACAVWSDPGIVFNEENSNVNYWEPWYLGYEKGVRRPAGVPNADRPRTGLYKRLVEAGRNLNELHALMCPRPVLVSGGTEDPPRNWRALNHMVKVNQLLGVENRVALTSRAGHIPTAEALEKELQFLELFLK